MMRPRLHAMLLLAATAVATLQAQTSSGDLYWTGPLGKNQVITVTGLQTSVGTIGGAVLPGKPVSIQKFSAAVELVEQPGPQNGWTRFSFRALRDIRQSISINFRWSLTGASGPTTPVALDGVSKTDAAQRPPPSSPSVLSPPAVGVEAPAAPAPEPAASASTPAPHTGRLVPLDASAPAPPHLSEVFWHGDWLVLILRAGINYSHPAPNGGPIRDDWCRAYAEVRWRQNRQYDVFVLQALIDRAGARLEALCPSERRPDGMFLRIDGGEMNDGLDGPLAIWTRYVYSASNWKLNVLFADRITDENRVPAAFSQDIKESISQLAIAAENGDRRAQLLLGAYYQYARTDSEQHLVPDYAAAASWYRRAAEQGSLAATLSLAKLHDAGLGVEIDDAERSRLLMLAAEMGHPRAMLLAGKWVHDSDDISSPNILHMLATAVPFYLKAAELGDPLARVELALSYLKARYVLVLRSSSERDRRDFSAWVDRYRPQVFPQTPAEAVSVLKGAASRGYCPALVRLGEVYLRGEGVEQDLSEAAGWLVNVEKCAGARDVDREYAKWMLSRALGDNPPPPLKIPPVAIGSRWDDGSDIDFNTMMAFFLGTAAVAWTLGTVFPSSAPAPEHTSPSLNLPDLFPGEGPARFTVGFIDDFWGK